MKKHECYIDTKTNLGEEWGGVWHPILAIEEDGFRNPYPPSSLHATDLLGYLEEHDDDDGKSPMQWRWRLMPFEHKGRDRESKPFDSKSDAIASLSKSLNRKGYRLVSGD